ncbi:unnamed protein product [Prorocentrum cordatum]|uniref:Uncharacterized protein n=1 Tax=Prorocentrum cordatum TaxID=2364126 RepID=A0ABN9Q9M3_9DINO|nr:unnamed protein product [Polarella glacialis]
MAPNGSRPVPWTKQQLAKGYGEWWNWNVHPPLPGDVVPQWGANTWRSRQFRPMVECGKCGRWLFQERLKAKKWTCECGARFHALDCPSERSSGGGGTNSAVQQLQAIAAELGTGGADVSAKKAVESLFAALRGPTIEARPRPPGQALQVATAGLQRGRRALETATEQWQRAAQEL